MMAVVFIHSHIAVHCFLELLLSIKCMLWLSTISFFFLFFIWNFIDFVVSFFYVERNNYIEKQRRQTNKERQKKKNDQNAVSTVVVILIEEFLWFSVLSASVFFFFLFFITFCHTNVDRNWYLSKVLNKKQKKWLRFINLLSEMLLTLKIFRFFSSFFI